MNDRPDSLDGAGEIVVNIAHDTDNDMWRAWSANVPEFDIKAADEPSLVALVETVMNRLAPKIPWIKRPGKWPSRTSLHHFFALAASVEKEIAEINSTKPETYEGRERRQSEIENLQRRLLGVATDEIGFTLYNDVATLMPLDKLGIDKPLFDDLTDHRFDNNPLPVYSNSQLTEMRNAVMQNRFSEIYGNWKKIPKKKFTKEVIVDEMRRRWPEYKIVAAVRMLRICKYPKSPKSP